MPTDRNTAESSVPRSVLLSLPPRASFGDFDSVRRLLEGRREKLVVLDDDPTGCQTMHGIDVFSQWSPEVLEGAFRDPRACFYILTNSRSLTEQKAAQLTFEVAGNLKTASARTGIPFTVVSRSDSTLRGHFKAEIDALHAALGVPVAATIVIPAFFEGGRFTINDIHYVAEGDELVPAARTEFASDKSFGYRNSRLPDWIEEKTYGAVPASQVISIPLDLLRSRNGASRVRDALLSVPSRSYVVVNAADYGDLEVFVHGLLLAESIGRHFLFRTAAGFVRVRSGTVPRPLLSPREISGEFSSGGLVAVGSYISKTTRQLQALQALPLVDSIELRVARLNEQTSREAEVARVVGAASETLACGRHAVVFTSRERNSELGAVGDLGAGAIVSASLVEVVRRLPVRPRFLIAKGGITSCDIATRGLGMTKALVKGQAVAGVPVWELGSETRFPGMNYIVWPGNVGGPDALRDLVDLL